MKKIYNCILNVAGMKPKVTDLDFGQLAINIVDGITYTPVYKNGAKTIVPVNKSLIDSTVGAQGPIGPDGLSAYQIAVAAGFVGDEAAWLASLKGADGTPGTGAPVILTEATTIYESGTYILDMTQGKFNVDVHGYTAMSIVIITGTVEQFGIKPRVMFTNAKLEGTTGSIELDMDYTTLRLEYSGDINHGYFIGE